MVASTHYKRNAWLLVGFSMVIPAVPAVLGAVIWLMVIGCMLLKMTRVHPQGKLRWKEDVSLWAIIGAASFIAVQMLVAVVLKQLGHSPYDHSLQGIAYNLFLLVPALVGREQIRAYAIGSLTDKGKRKKIFIVLILLMTLSQINTAAWATVSNLESFTIFIVKNVMPELCQNVVLSYLCLYGGALPSTLYAGILLGFEWLSPILPNYGWFARGIVSIVVPYLFLCMIQHLYGKLTKEVRKIEGKEGFVSLLVMSFIGVIAIWFVVGVFPVYPSVIMTGSMAPLIKPGDMILVDKVQEMEDINALQVGDILHFSREHIVITHRIVEVVTDENGNKSYRTKGDNNSIEDSELVEPQQVIGTVDTVIPKVGLPVLWLRGRSDVPTSEVEF